MSLCVISGCCLNRIIAVYCDVLHLYRKGSSRLSGVVTLYISPLSLPLPHLSLPLSPSLSVSLCQENLGFFLSACQKLGLKGGQLFGLEDLQEVSSAKSSASESK